MCCNFQFVSFFICCFFDLFLINQCYSFQFKNLETPKSMKFFEIKEEDKSFKSASLWNPLPTFLLYGGQIVSQL